MSYTICDGRITSIADQRAPERCQRCGYRGASLAPNATGTLVCSLCDPDGWDVPRCTASALIQAVGPDTWFRPFNIDALIERAEHAARLRGGERAEVERLRDIRSRYQPRGRDSK